MKEKPNELSIKHLTSKDLEKLLSIYNEHKNDDKSRQMIRDHVVSIISDLNYFSLLDLQKKCSEDQAEIKEIIEHRKIPLLKEYLQDKTDVFELELMFHKELISTDGPFTIMKRIKAVLIYNLENIKKVDDLVTFIGIAEDGSREEKFMIEKLKKKLADLSYQELIKVQRSRMFIKELIDETVEEAKLPKLEKICEKSSLKELVSLFFHEKIASSSQKFISKYMTQLIEKKICEINNLEDVIDYWNICEEDSQARKKLETKFYQLLSNLNYDEILTLKKRRFIFNNELKKIAERKQIELIPEYLDKLSSIEELRSAIVYEDHDSKILPLLEDKLIVLVEQKFNEINKLDDLIINFSFFKKNQDLQDRFFEKIKKNLEGCDNLFDLLNYHRTALFKPSIIFLIEKRILFLLKEKEQKKSLVKDFLKKINEDKLVSEKFKTDVNDIFS